ncbi:MAG: hypothetical protein ACOYMN_12995 [Roseimicrobium sp.]
MSAPSRFLCLLFLCATLEAQEGVTPVGAFGEAPHHYWTEPDDPFSKFIARVEKGEVKLDARASEKDFVAAFLRALEVPASSQLWVFSGTSLQSGRISPHTPRAIYFNEETYVGYVPGGQMEISSLDPERGMIFYIFDIPRDGGNVRFQRSERCMNCHAGDAQFKLPGLAGESVIPGPNTGSLDAFRRGLSGHTIALEDRFGGWVVTGAPASLQHHGNATGDLNAGKMTLTSVKPGTDFDPQRYPAPTSDLLAHLVFEHQVGFTNRVTEARYLTRAMMAAGKGRLRNEDAKVLDAKAAELASYLLFANEATLPREGITGDSAFKTDFLRNRKAAPDGTSLKDFDLHTRIFKHRCSYMLYSRVFTTLQPEFKKLVYAKLSAAVGETSAREYNYLPLPEKRAIRAIVGATLPRS